ncbi:MAG: Peptide chain release factor 2 [Candidatus Daviesbacteria bacterium GW2011_GWB1_41_5]|uniref:Peptide chain release factor 2 n=1 Tax=Candidatus Daviesbacteria bacterium GW2011_GWB1_41_5 TaxID=1618429 RepID=A0A0G0WJ83_9BACT|nr:MAG: Peptide chain release factor 2 [Candidatus Daviesbacteria bacterium GW2011_GWB1_41_5]
MGRIAVRVVHLPTGISAAAQSERSQGQNKEQAIAMLYARLWQRLQAEHLEEISQLKTKTEPGGVEWGSQIRSYVLHPYKQVKDHRTGVELHNPDTVLDGDLAEFIEAEIGQSV